MNWIEQWLANRRLQLTKSWAINWPDGSRDKCMQCGVYRFEHSSISHKFAEKR